MDPKQIKQILIPATALAAVIMVVAIIFGEFDQNGGKKEEGANARKKHESTATNPGIPAGADTSSEGMTDDKPSTEGADWLPLPGGLKMWDVKEGTGEPVGRGATVVAHYTGWLTNGTVFDSSVRRGEPTEFSLDGVIKGWTEGIPGMKVGGIRRLFIPWQMAYGARGNGDIPPKADLIFEVKLVAFR